MNDVQRNRRINQIAKDIERASWRVKTETRKLNRLLVEEHEIIGAEGRL